MLQSYTRADIFNRVEWQKDSTTAFKNKWPRGLWEEFYDFAVAEDVLTRVSLVVQSFTEFSSMK